MAGFHERTKRAGVALGYASLVLGLTPHALRSRPASGAKKRLASNVGRTRGESRSITRAHLMTPILAPFVTIALIENVAL